jgi:AcrR family transcriptional regulator
MVLPVAPADDDAETRVLATAHALFAAHGVQAVGMDAIRDASGVSLKRIYRLFPTKERLVEAALRRRRAQVIAELERATAALPTPQHRILAVFDLLGEWFAVPGYRGCEFLNAFGELGPSAEGVTAAVRQHKGDWRALFGTLVADAGGPPQLADQLTLLANGAMATAAVLGRSETAGDARAAAATLLHAAGSGACGGTWPMSPR